MGNQQVSPEKCHATGKGLEVAKLGERTTAVLHIVDNGGKPYMKPVVRETLTCELVSESTGEKIDCSMKKTEASGQYEISYQATSRGRHQLHIKVEGIHIIGSPFSILVKRQLNQIGKAMDAITGGQTDTSEEHKLNEPWGVAINSKGNIIIAENEGHCISVFSPGGEKVVLSFGTKGTSFGQFLYPRGVAVDGEDNILVADGNDRIQVFTSDGKFQASTPEYEDVVTLPYGIAVHPHSKKIYVAVSDDHCIKILNPDLTLSSSFGRKGSGNGEFMRPWDVAFDSTGNVYVTDFDNHRIQVFTVEGEYLRQFGWEGSDGEELNPNGICIDSEDVVYVTNWATNQVLLFDCQGVPLKPPFGSQGSELGQFATPCGIALDKDENIYVADLYNNRVQKF